jgi:hypothetical protein
MNTYSGPLEESENEPRPRLSSEEQTFSANSASSVTDVLRDMSRTLQRRARDTGSSSSEKTIIVGGRLGSSTRSTSISASNVVSPYPSLPGTIFIAGNSTNGGRNMTVWTAGNTSVVSVNNINNDEGENISGSSHDLGMDLDTTAQDLEQPGMAPLLAQPPLETAGNIVHSASEGQDLWVRDPSTPNEGRPRPKSVSSMRSRSPDSGESQNFAKTPRRSVQHGTPRNTGYLSDTSENAFYQTGAEALESKAKHRRKIIEAVNRLEEGSDDDLIIPAGDYASSAPIWWTSGMFTSQIWRMLC